MKNLTRNSIVLLCTFMCLSFTNLVYSQQTLSQINGWNAYVHLPASYSSTSTSYPTIIFFPGIGEIGTNPAALISAGPGAYIAQGWNGNVIVNGNTIEFIVISIQPPSGYPSEYWINEKIQTIKSLYRVNPDKLYLTGLSHGGWCATTYVTGDNYGGPYTYASQVAAVVEVQGVIPDDNSPYPNLFDNFAISGGKLLGFEQAFDNRGMPTRVNRMNATRPGSAIYVQTNFGGGGHCCWNQFYGGQGVQPGNFMLDGVSQNLYQWLARQSRNSGANQPPAANAGSNQAITLPNSSVTLSGSGTDPDGSIASYLWTKLSGPATGTITSANSAQTTITGLTQGVYQYQLKVTDNAGATGTAQVQVTVNAAANIPPVANAGPDQSITLPLSLATLNGSGTDSDGSIVSYSWSRVSGTGGSLLNLNTALTSIIGLLQGTHVFQLTVTDNSGATATDLVVITVNALLAPPPPTCNTSAPVTHLLSGTSPGEIYRPNGSAWKGGDTVKITGTYYSVIEFNNVGGDPCRPLVIMPATNLVTPIFRFKGNCRYIKLWGGTQPYGIKIVGGSLAIASCHHIEVNNVECSGGNNGVYCKQDVSYADTMTWNPNYRMTKFTFKNMWIHDISGEGMYMGITLPDGWTVTSTYSGLDTVIVPVRLDSVEVSNCIVERTAWDAIQLSNARNGNKIFNNTVRNYGTINMGSQQAGIILGGNTSGDIYGNTVIKGTGNGIQAFGYGVINIYNNTLDSCGYDGAVNSNGTEGQQSIYASDYVSTTENNPRQTINAYGNIINHPKSSGAIFITNYANYSLPSSVYNNTFCIPNAPGNWQSIYLHLNVPGSVNNNNILSCSGVTNNAPLANAGADVSITLPVSGVTLSGSGTDTDGTITGYQWTKISGPAATLASPASATSAVSGLVEGVYKFELKVTDNGGAFATDTVQVTVNAAAIVLLPSVNPANTVNGLDYKYYEGNWSLVPVFSSLTPVASGTTSNFNIGLALRPSLFGFSFTGYVNVPADGVYTFYTTSDDGSNLYIDNVLAVNNDGLHAAIEKSGSIGLKAGKHAISGLFFENTGEHIFTVSYEGPGVTKQPIPAGQLYRVGPPNIPPVTNAGADISITMPASSVTLTGSATDADGTVTSYQWTRVPVTGTFVTPAFIGSYTSPSTVVTNLTEGVYQFELKATDNLGAWSVDTVQITVSPAGITLLPAVNPANTVNGLDYKYYEGSWFSLPNFSSLTALRTGTVANFDLSVATSTDYFGVNYTGYINVPADGMYTFYTTSDDGSIILIDNVLVVNNDGLHAPIERSGTIGLKAGKHAISAQFFELNGGEVFYVGYEGPGLTKQLVPSSALYRIGTTTNIAPVANAGANQSIATATTTLSGSGADADGTITSYAWTVVSGPAGSSFSTPSLASTAVTGLTTGTYQFRLTVTDNAGATASAVVQVLVTLPVTAAKTIRVNIFGGSNPFTDTKWNNWNIAAGLNSGYLLDENRGGTSIRASLTGDVMLVDNGAGYATASTTPPSPVLRYNSATTSFRYLTFTGLNPAKRYSLEYYGSRANTGNKTLVTIGSLSDTISTDYNVSDYARFVNISPDATGVISATISRIGVWTYLSGFTIIEQPDAQTARGELPPATVTDNPTPSVTLKKGEDIVEAGANAVSVYPNPFSGAFKVQISNKELGDFVIKLSGQTGQTVFYKKINKTIATFTETINVSNLAPGSYILQIISVSTGNTTVHKVIKN